MAMIGRLIRKTEPHPECCLGVEVKGLWLADFDSGDGYYYCWQLGEDDIEHFHRYETGFAGRRPITLLD